MGKVARFDRTPAPTSTAVRMTLESVVRLEGALDAIACFASVGRLLAYGLARNRAVVRAETAALAEARKPVAGWDEWQTERVDLARSHARIDGNGKPVIEDGQFQILDAPAFAAALVQLREKHAPAISAQRTREAELMELMKTEVELALQMLPLSLFPSTGVPAHVYDGLMPLLIQDEGR